MNDGLKIGIKGSKEMTVLEKHLASSLGSGLVNVFATAMMIAGMEEVCVASVEPYLDEGFTTVGVGVDVRHCSASPVGIKVRFESELVEISQNGKGLDFAVKAWDETDLIGEGTIRRVIVKKAAFEEKARQKLGRG